jgi:hypothetical protein
VNIVKVVIREIEIQKEEIGQTKIGEIAQIEILIGILKHVVMMEMKI